MLRLPVELLDEVLGYLDRSDLCQWCLVSKAGLLLAQIRLYRRINLNSRGAVHRRRCALLQSTLVASGPLANLITHFTLSFALPLSAPGGFAWCYSKLCGFSKNLKSLRLLQVGMSIHGLQPIFDATSVHLEAFEFTSTAKGPQVAESLIQFLARLPLLESLALDFSTNDTSPMKFPFALTRLSVVYQSKPLFDQLVQQSQGSLRHLCFGNEPLEEQLTIPILPNLASLTFIRFYRMDGPPSPLGEFEGRHVPNLQCLTMNLFYETAGLPLYLKSMHFPPTFRVLALDGSQPEHLDVLREEILACGAQHFGGLEEIRWYASPNNPTAYAQWDALVEVCDAFGWRTTRGLTHELEDEESESEGTSFI